MRPLNKRGKKKLVQPRDGAETGIFLAGYLVAYGLHQKKKSARGPQSRIVEDVIIWINLGWVEQGPVPVESSGSRVRLQGLKSHLSLLLAVQPRASLLRSLNFTFSHFKMGIFTDPTQKTRRRVSWANPCDSTGPGTQQELQKDWTPVLFCTMGQGWGPATLYLGSKWINDSSKYD